MDRGHSTDLRLDTSPEPLFSSSGDSNSNLTCTSNSQMREKMGHISEHRSQSTESPQSESLHCSSANYRRQSTRRHQMLSTSTAPFPSLCKTAVVILTCLLLSPLGGLQGADAFTQRLFEEHGNGKYSHWTRQGPTWVHSAMTYCQDIFAYERWNCSYHHFRHIITHGQPVAEEWRNDYEAMFAENAAPSTEGPSSTYSDYDDDDTGYDYGGGWKEVQQQQPSVEKVVDASWVHVSTPNPSDVSVEVPAMLKGTKEAAYVQALTAASMLVTTFSSCFDGTVLCECDGQFDKNDADFDALEFDELNEDNLRKSDCHYSYRKAALRSMSHFKRSWVMSKENAHDVMLLHNMDSGKRAVVKHLSERCTCVGLSGACEHKVCWEEMPSLLDVALRLKGYYKDSQLSHKTRPVKRIGGYVLMLGSEGESGGPPSGYPRANHLVYTDDSPSYCETVANRMCEGWTTVQLHDYDYADEEEEDYKKEGVNGDSCEDMCGTCEMKVKSYYEVNLLEECECDFIWCCEVDCSGCNQRREYRTCEKPSIYSSTPRSPPPGSFSQLQ